MDPRYIGETVRSLNAAWTGGFPRFYGPVGDDAFAAVESELTGRLPESYRTFLRQFGAAYMLGHEFAGIPPTRSTDDVPQEFEHIADVNRQMKRRGGIEDHLVLFANDGSDY